MLTCGCGKELQGVLVYRKIGDTVIYDQDKREREVDSTHILTENVLLQFSISFLTLILFEIYEIKNVFQALEKLQNQL